MEDPSGYEPEYTRRESIPSAPTVGIASHSVSVEIAAPARSLSTKRSQYRAGAGAYSMKERSASSERYSQSLAAPKGRASLSGREEKRSVCVEEENRAEPRHIVQLLHHSTF